MNSLNVTLYLKAGTFCFIILCLTGILLPEIGQTAQKRKSTDGSGGRRSIAVATCSYRISPHTHNVRSKCHLSKHCMENPHLSAGLLQDHRLLIIEYEMGRELLSVKIDKLAGTFSTPSLCERAVSDTLSFILPCPFKSLFQQLVHRATNKHAD
jgi:hypothetical protein